MIALTPLEVLLRLGAAFIAGALLGLERERHGRPAGLRTTVLTCLAAAAAAILAHQYSVMYNVQGQSGVLRSDPGRLAAGVLTGIGFLGAGTIMRHGSLVRGVTTAAVLWLSTVLGLVLGSGQWAEAFTALVFAGLTMGVLPILDRHIERNFYGSLTVVFRENVTHDSALRQTIEHCGATIQRTSYDYDVENGRNSATYQIKLRTATGPQTFSIIEQMLDGLRATEGVLGVQWRQ